MTSVRTFVSVIVAVVSLAAAAGGATGSIEVALDTPVATEGDAVSGSVSGTATGENVLVTWQDAFGGVWYSTQAAAGTLEPASFAFTAVGPAVFLTSVRAVSSARTASAPLAVFPKKDATWDSFVIVADGVPQAMAQAASACRRLGITAAMARGYVDCLAAARAGLRPVAFGLTSSAPAPAAALAGSPAQVLPSVSDAEETARLATEMTHQITAIRQLAPLCLVVAEGPLAVNATPEDLSALDDYVSSRLDESSAPAPEPEVDFATDAFGLEYDDMLAASAVTNLSRIATSAEMAAGDEAFSWNAIAPVTAITGLDAPSALGGLDWTRLPSSANLVILSADAPWWVVPFARDLDTDGKVFASVDAAAADPARNAWRAVSAGAAGIVVGHSDGVIAGAGSSSQSQANPPADNLAASFAEISGGLGDLMAASANDASVALVYSPASIRAAYELALMPAPPSQSPAAGNSSPASRLAAPDIGSRALAAWSEILADLGVDYKWVSIDSFKEMNVTRSSFAAVILPETWCIDESSAAALSDYVDSGGTLIADNGAGLFDGAYTPYTSAGTDSNGPQAAPLDRLFGISRQPVSLDVIKAISPWASRGGTVVADASLSVSRQSGAKTTSPDKTFIARASGRGGTVYLNIVTEGYLGGGDAARSAVRAAVARALDAAAVAPLAQTSQGGRALPSRISSKTFGRTRVYFIEPSQAGLAAGPVTVSFPIAADFYNLRPSDRGGEYLGNAARFTVAAPAVGPVVLAATAVRLTGLAVDLDYSRGTIIVTAQAEGERPVGDRFLHVEIYGPDGTHYPQFDRAVQAAGGTYVGAIDLPLNAPAGAWRVLVRDLETGMASWSDVDVLGQ